MSNIYSIYKATNIINGKCYIGYDSNWPQRKYSHLSESKNPKLASFHYYFHRTIRKYTPNNFNWEILYTTRDLDVVKYMEKYFILEYNSKQPTGYNMTDGGEGGTGYKWTEKQKQKVKGRPSPHRGKKYPTISVRMKGPLNPMSIRRINKGSFQKGHKISSPNSLATKEKKRQTNFLFSV